MDHHHSSNDHHPQQLLLLHTTATAVADESIDYVHHSSTADNHDNQKELEKFNERQLIDDDDDALSLHRGDEGCTLIQDEGDEDDHPNNSITYDEAINQLGFGLFQVLLMQVCGAGSFFDGVELSLISFVIPELKSKWSLTPVETGALGSIVFFGMMFGAWFGGFISDKFGRKLVFSSSIGISSLFLLASCFSVNFWMLVSLRFFVGLGLGAMVPCDFSLMLEYLPSKNRGALLGLLQIYWSIGAAIECFISWLCIEVISKQFDKGHALSDGWRWCMAFSSLIGFTIFVLRLFVPESPRFNLIKKDFKNVDKTIEKIEKLNKKSLNGKKVRLVVTKSSSMSSSMSSSISSGLISIDNSNSNINNQITLNHVESLTMLNQFKMLFSKEFLASTLLLFIIWFMLSYGGWGFNFLIPIVFEKMKNNNVYLNTFYVTSIGFVSNIITLFIIDKIPRRTLMGSTFILTGICTALVGVSNNPYSILTFSMMANFMSSFPWALLYTYTPEYYPTSIRTTGMGACSVFTRLAGAITPMVGSLVLESGYFVPFLTYGIAMIIAGVCSFLLRKETLNSSLQDVSIQQKPKDYGYSELTNDLLNEPLNGESVVDHHLNDDMHNCNVDDGLNGDDDDEVLSIISVEKVK